MNEKKDFDVICMGVIAQDILVSGVSSKELGSDVSAIIASSMQYAVGGDAANEAAVLAKLGQHTGFLGVFGTDARGLQLDSALKAMKVDTSIAIRKEDCENITSIVLMKDDGTHTFLVGMGKNNFPDKSSLDLSVFGRTRAFCAGSLYAMGDLETGGLDEVFQAARAGGAVIFADMDFDLHGRGPRAFDDIYQYIDYLVPSFEEANYVTGLEKPEDIAAFFLDKGAGNVVIKLGGSGSFFRNRERSFYTAAYDIEPINTTGCGDNFTAGFIHSILNGKDPEEAVLFASAAGALNTQGIGASMYVQSEEHVREFMRTHRQKCR